MLPELRLIIRDYQVSEPRYYELHKHNYVHSIPGPKVKCARINYVFCAAIPIVIVFIITVMMIKFVNNETVRILLSWIPFAFACVLYGIGWIICGCSAVREYCFPGDADLVEQFKRDNAKRWEFWNEYQMSLRLHSLNSNISSFDDVAKFRDDPSTRSKASWSTVVFLISFFLLSLGLFVSVMVIT
jgi:hypothetical protein